MTYRRKNFDLVEALLVLGIVALLVFIGSLAHCDEPTPAPIPATACSNIPGFFPCQVVWEAESGTETLFKPGKDHYVIAFSRVQADIIAPLDSHIFCRVDVSALSDGKAAPSLTDPQSFQTLELYCGTYKSSGVFSLIGLGGVAFPIIPGTTDTVAQKYPRVLAGGLMIGLPRSGTFVMLLAGLDEAASTKLVLPLAGQIRLQAKTFITFDGALDVLGKNSQLGGSFLRIGAAQRF